MLQYDYYATFPRLQQRVLRMRLAENRTFTAARLDDENIFPSYTFLNFDPRLAALELVKKDLSLWDAEVRADSPIAN
jgi:hypothetical protein